MQRGEIVAEFAKVAHEWVRMCKAYSDIGDCMKCPLVHNPVCGCMCDGNGASEKDIAKAESDIMAWAAEHPEPVYPTWGEWFLQTCQVGLTDDCRANDWIGLLKSHIPPELAKRLEIEPKEVNRVT